MLRHNLILHIMTKIDHCLNEKIKKLIGLIRDLLGGK